MTSWHDPTPRRFRFLPLLPGIILAGSYIALLAHRIVW